MFDKIWEAIQWAFEALVPIVVLQPFERAVLVRMGTFVRELGPGWHLVYPLHIDKVWHDNVVARTEHITGLATTTSDGKTIGFDAVVTYKIEDIKKAILEVNDLKDAVSDSCAGHISTALADSTWDEILHGKTVDSLTAICRRRAKKWGIEVIQVQLSGVCLVRNIRLSGNQQQHHTMQPS
jgi:regulator of protease activity HflC (stomatin/prohibitin superfamily)